MDELFHYGTPRHSGRYPWGSGENPQRNKNFLSYYNEYKKEGLKERQIAEILIGPGATSSQLRARVSIATNEIKKENVDRAMKLHEKGYSNTKIGEMMGGVSESTVRSWLKNNPTGRKDRIAEVADILRDQVDSKGYIDVGKGTEYSVTTSNGKNPSSTTMNYALDRLKEEGYKVINVQVDQQGTAAGMKTTVKVLAPPGTTYKDVNKNKDQIRTIENYISDDGKQVSRLGLPPINSVSSDRIMIRYEEDGGTARDGLIEIRRGMNDVTLGNAKYAQVRIPVDNKAYLKGMAVYSDDMPPGVDIIFNTNKPRSKGKLGVMKPLVMKDGKKADETTETEPNPQNPFGSSIKPEENLKRVPRYYIDENGKQQVSPVNVVYEEGDWKEWTKTLASQMLSKQPIQLVKSQLELTYNIKKAEFDEICAVTNPVVKKKLLDGFQSDMDSTAVHLKAASLPRQRSHVILPLPEIKETEIFAPGYQDGEKVALIRFPHGGTFEIPVLTVNNKNKRGREIIGTDSPDAVGIHPKAAVKLSGADFDGDTVLVIPTNDRVRIKADEMLKDLKGFDEKKGDLYGIDRSDPIQAKYPKIKKGSKQEQRLMGEVSNLITDMTLKGASPEEIARAVKHSMVVIDTAKHDLDYRKSYKDNGIDELKRLYQIKEGGKYGGASTIISSAKSQVRIPRREIDKERAGNSMGWDPETGEILYKNKKGDTYLEIKKDKKTGEWYETGKVKTRTETSTKMAETKDAFDLVSTFQTPVERAYANFANQCKNLANEARKEYLRVETPKKDPQAAIKYAEEVESLNAKLVRALKNSPRERQAQLYADKTMEMERQAIYPETMDKDVAQKKRAQALAAGRDRFNAKKDPVKFTDKEWEAVQARAISPSKLKDLLDNSDLDQVKKLSMPRTSKGLLPAQEATAKSMRARGYTLEEIADRFGVSKSTIENAVL